MASESLGSATLELRTDDTHYDIDGAKREAEGLEGSLDSAGASATALGQAMAAAAAAGIAALVSLTAKAVEAADVQIQAENRLGAALDLMGQNSDGALDSLKGWASELQSITLVGDEAALAMTQTAISMGLTAEKAQVAVQEAIGMSAAFGIAENSAIRMTAGLAAGETSMLTRYIPTLKGVEDETQKAAMAHDILGKAFGIATTQAESGLGPWIQFKNMTGDLLEVMGMLVIEAIEPAIAALKVLASSDAAPQFFEALGTVVGAVIKTLLAFGKVALQVMSAVLDSWGRAFAEMFMVIANLPPAVFELVPGLERLGEVTGGFATALLQGRDLSNDMIDALNGVKREAEETELPVAQLAVATEDLAAAEGEATQSLSEMIAEMARAAQESSDLGLVFDKTVIPSTKDVTASTIETAIAFDEMGLAAELAALRAKQSFELMAAEIKIIATEFGAELAGYITDGIINGFGSGQEISDYLESTFADMGAQAGEAIGFYFGGPIGAAIGKVIGEEIGKAVGEALGSMFTGRDATGEALAKFGLEVSKELKAIIRQTSIDLATEAETALRVHLGDIIREIGIESAEALGEFVHLAELLLYDLERGLLSSENAVIALDDALGELLANFEAAGGGLEELNGIADIFGHTIGSVVDGQLDAAQATELLNDHFGDFIDLAVGFGEEGLAAIQGIVEAATNAGLEVEVIAQRLRDAMGEALDVFAQRQALLVSESNKLVAAIESILMMGGGGARQLEFATTSVLQAFDALIAGGVPLSQVIQTLENAFGLINDEATRLGETVPPEFARLGDVLDILADDQLQGAIAKLEQIQAAASAAGNMGLLTADQFDFFGDRIDATFDKLIDGGLTGEEALAAIAPQLQVLHDLSQQYGFAVDKNTQALLDQALAQGLVQDKGMTMEDILIAGFDRMLEGINALIVALGGIPLVFESIGGAVNDLADDLSHIEVNVDVNFDIEDLDLPGFATGSAGIQNFGGGTPAVLHGREEVLTAAQGSGVAEMVRQAIRSGGVSGSSSQVESLLREQTEWLAENWTELNKQTKLSAAALKEQKKGGKLSNSVPQPLRNVGTVC